MPDDLLNSSGFENKGSKVNLNASGLEYISQSLIEEYEQPVMVQQPNQFILPNLPPRKSSSFEKLNSHSSLEKDLASEDEEDINTFEMLKKKSVKRSETES